MANITKTRIGMDININYSIMRVDAPENLNNADNISVKLVHTQSQSWQLPNSFEIVGDNTLKIKIKGCDLIQPGMYRMIISYTKYNPDRDPHAEPFIIDCLAFNLVRHSDMVSDSDSCPNLSVTQINLQGTLNKNQDGNDGATPEIGANGNWWIKDVDTGLQAKGDKFKYSDYTPEELESLSFKYSDFTTEQLDALQKPALDAIDMVLETNKNINSAETARNLAEEKRQTDTTSALSATNTATLNADSATSSADSATFSANRAASNASSATTSANTATDNAKIAIINTNTATDRATNIANHPNIIIEDYWYQWDYDTQEYVNLNIIAKGGVELPVFDINTSTGELIMTQDDNISQIDFEIREDKLYLKL